METRMRKLLRDELSRCPHCAGPLDPAGDYLVCPMGVVYREHEGRLMVWSLGWVEVDE